MPIEATAFSGLVFANYLALFPLALGAKRENPSTGVPPHCVPEAFLGALCRAFGTVLKATPIRDTGAGTAALPGLAPPVPFVFPGIVVAQAQFLTSQGWVGPMAALGASAMIGAPLLYASSLGVLQMQPNLLMGTGVGIVSPLANPGLEATVTAALTAALLAEFQATGKFGVGDVPGAPVNATLAAQLPNYAAALAKGISSITATVAYVGNVSTVVPIAGTSNTGIIL